MLLLYRFPSQKLGLACFPPFAVRARQTDSVCPSVRLSRPSLPPWRSASSFGLNSHSPRGASFHLSSRGRGVLSPVRSVVILCQLKTSASVCSKCVEGKKMCWEFGQCWAGRLVRSMTRAEEISWQDDGDCRRIASLRLVFACRSSPKTESWQCEWFSAMGVYECSFRDVNFGRLLCAVFRVCSYEELLVNFLYRAYVCILESL